MISKHLLFFNILFLLRLIIEQCQAELINACCPQGFILEKNLCVETTLVEDFLNLPLFINASKNLTITTNLPSCAGAKIITTIEASELVTQADEDYGEDIDASAITDSGYLRFQTAFYSPREYCLSSSANGNLRIRLCEPNCHENFRCIPKCCLLNEVIEFTRTENGGKIQNCIPAVPIPWSPVIYKDLITPLGEGDSNYPVHFYFEEPAEWNASECQVATYPYKGAMEVDFRLLSNGDVFLRGMNPNWQKVVGKYCVDGTANNGKFSGYENDTVVMHCFPNSRISKGADYILGKIYYYVILVSAFFLLLTILVYAVLWEKHTLHGFSLLSYFISLFVMEMGYLTSFVMAENSVFRGNNLIISNACLAVAVFTHFGLIWAFSWMTVVNFDLWCTFRNLKSTLTSAKGVKKYLKYFMFALFIPILIVGIGLTLDLNYGDAMPYHRKLILPDYAKRKCYISNPNARLPYVFAPIAVLLAVNIFFFITTMFALKEANDMSKLARRHGPTRRQSYVYLHSDGREERRYRTWPLESYNLVSHYRLVLIAKLICVMGVFWVFEVISFAATVGNQVDVGSNEVPWYWVTLDLVIHMQGVIIFIIFICKRDIIQSLRHKFSFIDRFCEWIFIYCPNCAPAHCGSRHTTATILDSEIERPRVNSVNTKLTNLPNLTGCEPAAIENLAMQKLLPKQATNT